MVFKDYYQILEILPSATKQDVKQAYRKMSLKWHPDKNIGVDVTKMMQDINEAYKILSDDSLRSKYNREYYAFIQTQVSGASRQKDFGYYEYEVKDENLKNDINEAREYAENLVDEFLRSLKKTSKTAVKGAYDYVYGVLIGFLVFFACVLFFYIAYEGNIVSLELTETKNSQKSDISYGRSSAFDDRIETKNSWHVPLLVEQPSAFCGRTETKNTSIVGCKYENQYYSIKYPGNWECVENPTWFTDVHIGSPEKVLCAFTISRGETTYTLYDAMSEAVNGSRSAGFHIIEDKKLIEGFTIDGTECYRYVYSGQVANIAVEKCVSYGFENDGMVYFINFYNVPDTMIELIINTFQFK